MSAHEATILPSPEGGKRTGSAGGRPGWLAWSAVAVAAVLVAGSLSNSSTTAQGDAREASRPEMFLSGGARSEAVLKEISETLKRIDARLERFEKTLRKEDANRGEGAGAAAADPPSRDAGARDDH